MEEYIVSARKYRPMTFDSVVGQSALTTTLKNAVRSGKLAHAYLFCGPRGVGKTTCARIFAKAINCLTPTEGGEACNHCESCQAFNEQRSYNIFELDAASNNSVENIKSLMEQTRIPPQVGKYKVFIIDEVHMLSMQAFNAFLKTLEEPPQHVIFILATTEKHKILPTIISRCQIYDFERMTVENTIAHLKRVAEQEGVTYEEEALAVIAEKSDGGMRDALSIFDQAVSFCQGNITYQKVIEDLNVLDSDNYFRIVDLALANKVPDIMVLLNQIISRGFDGGHLVSGLAAHVRNVLMAKDPQTLPLLEVSRQQQERYQQQAAHCPTPFLYKALRLMNQCDQAYRASSNKRLLVELTLIQVAQLTQPDDADVPAGRSPKRLKSLFQNLLRQAQQKKVARQGGTAEPKPQTNERELKTDAQALKTDAQALKTDETNGHTLKTGRQSSVSSVLPPPPASSDLEKSSVSSVLKTSSASSVPSGSVPKFKLDSLGITFAGIRRQNAAAVEQAEPEEEKLEDNQPFTVDQLRQTWLAMCNRMAAIKEMTALAQRMKNMSPVIVDGEHTVEVAADNELLLNQLTIIQGRIRKTLINDLHNGLIQFRLRLAEAQEVRPVMSKREIFDEIRRENPAIEKLRAAFDLQLS